MIKKISAIFFCLIILGCGAQGNITKDYSKPTKNSGFEVYKRTEVKKEEYNSTWPFSVDSGFIECVTIKEGKTWIFTASNGKSYHVAGNYEYIMRNLLKDNIDEIWLKSPYDSDARVSMTPVTMKALEFCGP